MTRDEVERELSDITAEIDRLQVRALFLQTRLRRLQAEEGAARPGWPIVRALQATGARISTSASPRIAV